MKVILRDVNWIKVAFYLGTALLVWASLWLFDTLIPLIDPKAVANYLRDETPLQFLVSAFQNRIVGLLWQPIAAVLAIAALSKPLGKVYDHITVSVSPPGFLRRVDEKSANRIVVRRFPLIGRDRELHILRAFAEDKRLFVWCWMTGRGMQGKTRLAVEACLRLTRGDWSRKWRACHAGFLGPSQDANYWKSWQPNRPTFIVVDDAASRPSDVEQLLIGLAQRVHNLRSPVRVLLVDRHASEGLGKLETNQLLRQATFQADGRIEVVDFEGEERKRFFSEVLSRSLRPPLGDAAVTVRFYEEWAHSKAFTGALHNSYRGYPSCL